MTEYIEREALIEKIVNSPTVPTRQCYEGNFVYADGTASRQNEIINYISEQPTADVVEIPKSGIGDLSDGYHTFNELYHHRAVLFSVICNLFKDKAWKSKKHDTGDMYDGMFIVGIETPQGQATYHYDIDPYWEMFKVKELPNAPNWDGHTPEEAIRRIGMLQVDNVIVPPCKVGDTVYAIGNKDGYQIKECRAEEFYFIDAEKFQVDVCFECDTDCEGCYFSSWSQSHCGEWSCGGEYGNGFIPVDDFGKTVFLTREEAEQALAEREGKDGK